MLMRSPRVRRPLWPRLETAWIPATSACLGSFGRTAAACILFSAGFGHARPLENTTARSRGRELVRDRHFQGAFKVLDPAPGRLLHRGVLQWGTAQTDPIWNLAQWNSRFSLAGAQPVRLPSGAIRFSNEGKAVVVGASGMPEADLILAVDNRTECGGRARRRGEPWVHLLVSQRFEDPPVVARLAQLPFAVSARLLDAKLHVTPDHTPGLHAAQFQIFLTIQKALTCSVSG